MLMSPNGTCWLWSFLVPFGHCEHGVFQSIQRRPTLSPTVADNEYQSKYRALVANILVRDNKPLVERALTESCVSAKGGFGDQDNFEALCELMHVSCLLHTNVGSSYDFVEYLHVRK